MVLLIIDAQKQITNERIYCFERFVENVKLLISEARKNSVEVIYVRHDDGAGTQLTKGLEGFEIYEEFSPNDNEKIFDKTVNSPFRDTGLLEYLKEKQVKTVVVAGLQTEYCIDATVKCGFEHRFDVIIPQYANSTFDNEFMTAEQTYKYYNNFIWNRRYGKSITVADTIELMKNHGEQNK